MTRPTKIKINNYWLICHLLNILFMTIMNSTFSFFTHTQTQIPTELEWYNFSLVIKLLGTIDLVQLQRNQHKIDWRRLCLPFSTGSLQEQTCCSGLSGPGGWSGEQFPGQCRVPKSQFTPYKTTTTMTKKKKKENYLKIFY